MSEISSDLINQARASLEGASSILIAIGNNPNMDNVASALSMYLALSATGKQISIVCPVQMTVAYNQLVGVDKISTSVNSQAGKNLVIAFPYQEGSIEKVSYNIENETFNLVIEPREGYPLITEEMIKYSYTGGNVDAVIIFGVAGFENLENIYQSNKSLFEGKTVINIDNNPNNQKFGKINLIDTSTSCLCELTTNLLSQLGLALEPDISTNLLAGLIEGTGNFSSTTSSASTFETAAILMKNGARKIKIQETPRNYPSFNKPVPQNQFQTAQKTGTPFPKINRPFSPKPVSNAPFQSQKPKFQSKPTQAAAPSPVTQESTHPETPPDWLKPKIYKGSTLL